MEKSVVSADKIKAYTAKGFKLFILLMALGLALSLWLGQSDKPPQTEKMNEKAPIHDLTQAIEDKSLWLFKAQNQLSEQQGKQEKLSQELEELKKSIHPLEEVSNLKNRIEHLEQKTVALSESSYSPQTETEAEEFETYTSSPIESNDEAPHLSTFQPSSQLTSSIFSENLSLALSPQSKLPHKDSFIPPGTYTKAVLLNGIDVSAGVSSQASPKPVLLRLIDKGSLPNKAFGHLKDCRIIAAAFGDLSSERAYLRLEKLSCVQPNGEVIVTDVDGYVNGEDGKNGLRGPVVIRDTAVLSRGLLGGLLSGLGKATTQSYHSTAVSPFGAVNVSSAKGLDIFKQAGSQGVGDAFELMAKYNIQRAEQYQPVIQISAGRFVDVVFHSGSQFGEKKVRAPIKEPVPQNNNLPGQSTYGE